MNDQPTTGTSTQQFLMTHQLALEVRMHGDEQAPGKTTLIGWVIPKLDNARDALPARKMLARIVFGDENGGAEMTFYRPDGTLVVDLSQDRGDEEAPDDPQINRPLNEAWAGDPDAGFMEAVHDSMTRTVRVMIAAKALASLRGEDEQQVFEQLSRMGGAAFGDHTPADVFQAPPSETIEQEETP